MRPPHTHVQRLLRHLTGRRQVPLSENGVVFSIRSYFRATWRADGGDALLRLAENIACIASSRAFV